MTAIDDVLAAGRVLKFRPLTNPKPARPCGLCTHHQTAHTWADRYLGPCLCCDCTGWRQISPATIARRFVRFIGQRYRPI